MLYKLQDLALGGCAPYRLIQEKLQQMGHKTGSSSADLPPALMWLDSRISAFDQPLMISPVYNGLQAHTPFQRWDAFTLRLADALDSTLPTRDSLLSSSLNVRHFNKALHFILALFASKGQTAIGCRSED